MRGHRIRYASLLRWALLCLGLLCSGQVSAQVVISLASEPGAARYTAPATFEARETDPTACTSASVHEAWWVTDSAGQVVPGSTATATINNTASFPCSSARTYTFSFPVPADYTVHYGFSNGAFLGWFCRNWRACQSTGTLAVSQCSQYIGDGSVNELYRSGNARFAEAKVINAGIPASEYGRWWVRACSGTGNQQSCTGSPASTNIANANTANYPWFVWDENVFTNQKVFSFVQGMDVALYDAGGAPIDYVSVSGYTLQQPTSCPLPYDTDIVANNQDGDVYRLPDGTGDWAFVQKGPPTRAAMNAGVAGRLDHFTITPASTAGSTCAPTAVTVTAWDRQGNVYTDYTGTIDVSTSSNHGNWNINTGAGGTTPTVDNDDNGQVAYFFDLNSADQGQVVLDLSNTHADDLTITVADVADPTITASTSLYSFRDNAFVITDVDPLPGSDVAVAGRDHALRATLWTRDGGNCAVATKYTGSIPLKAWYSPDAQHPGGALAPAVAGSTLATAQPATANATLSFSGGQADFVLGTQDVGKYSLELLDDSSGFAVVQNGAARPIAGGTTAPLTVRPFAFGFTGITDGTTSDPGGTATAGAGFTAAGRPFQATLGAYLWEAADDADGDGLPDSGANVTDNGITPAFAWDASIDRNLDSPASGSLGSLTKSDPLAADFSGGQASLTGLRYAEVGSIRLAATATDYLGSAGVDVAGSSPVVGRFFPDHFALASSAITAGCAAGGYTYMSEPALGIDMKIEARNASDATTANYDSGLYTIGTGDLMLTAENNNDGVDLSARATAPAQTWTAGVYTLAGLSAPATFARALGGPDGPYRQLRFGARVTGDPDNVLLANPDMNPATTGDCSTAGNCDAVALAGGAVSDLRFGRAVVENAFGSEYTALPVPLRAQFYDGANGFVTNTDDSCTAVATARLDLSRGSENPAAGTTSISVDGSNITTASIAYDPFGTGEAGLSFSPPDAPGYVDVDVLLAGAAGLPDLGWLLYDWNGDGSDENPPTAQARFGSYRGDDRIIYWKENL